MLVNARIDFAKAQSTSGKVRIRVLVHPHNTKVLEPVKARGFVAVGICKPVEAIAAAGDSMLIEPDRVAIPSEVFEGPGIFMMELETTK